MNFLLKATAIFLSLLVFLDITHCVTQYQYKRYTYKKKRDDKRYKTLRNRCEMDGNCVGIWGVEHTKCIRKCMSEFCYSELYGEDELEEGEIDVRLNSYKGCLHQAKIDAADF